MKKKIIILLIVLIVLLSGFITFMIILNNKKEEVIEEPIVKAEELNIVLKENLSVEFLKEVRVSDFIESINYELVDDFVIDTMDIGKKEVVFEVMDSNNKRIRSSFDINIIDVTGPTIWLSGSYTVMEGSNIDLAKSIMCIDDTDDNPTTSVEGYYDLDSAGSYPLVYKASDKYGNTSEEYFNLYVIDYTTTPYNGEPLSFDYVLNTYKNDNTMIGLDISSWQGTIDFDKIKDAGVEFVFIRIGSEDNEGRFIDSKFERNYEEAKRVGLKVGVYYYSYAESEEYAITDAKYVLDALNGRSLDLPIAFDFEDWGRFNNYHFSKLHLTKVAKAFLDEVKKAGYEGLNYSSKVFLEEVWLNTSYPTWLAHYTDQTSYKGDYSFWQFSSMTVVDGVNGYVDCNVGYLNR